MVTYDYPRSPRYKIGDVVKITSYKDTYIVEGFTSNFTRIGNDYTNGEIKYRLRNMNTNSIIVDISESSITPVEKQQKTIDIDKYLDQYNELMEKYRTSLALHKVFESDEYSIAADKFLRDANEIMEKLRQIKL